MSFRRHCDGIIIHIGRGAPNGLWHVAFRPLDRSFYATYLKNCDRGEPLGAPNTLLL